MAVRVQEIVEEDVCVRRHSGNALSYAAVIVIIISRINVLSIGTTALLECFVKYFSFISL